MIYIGIDPGKSGALGCIDTSNGAAFAVPFNREAYINELRNCAQKEAIVCLEHVGARPGQGVTSMFSFGENFGFIRGVLEANGIPYELVRPQKWKKEFSITADKNGAVEVCKRLFPGVSLLPTGKCRKDSDGMAESLLMAEYARRKFR